MTLTDWLAIYGAVLSTILGFISIGLAINEILKNKRKVIVVCKKSYGVENSRDRTIAKIKVTNIGHRPITITEVGFELGKKRKVEMTWTEPMGNNPLPKLLNDGESETVCIDFDKCDIWKETLSVDYMSAYACDAEGKYYKTNLPKDFGN